MAQPSKREKVQQRRAVITVNKKKTKEKRSKKQIR